MSFKSLDTPSLSMDTTLKIVPFVYSKFIVGLSETEKLLKTVDT